MPKRPKSPPPPPPSTAITYTLTGAAMLSGLSVATLRRKEKNGHLEFVKVGYRTMVKGDSFRRMLGI